LAETNHAKASGPLTDAKSGHWPSALRGGSRRATTRFPPPRASPGSSDAPVGPALPTTPGPRSDLSGRSVCTRAKAGGTVLCVQAPALPRARSSLNQRGHHVNGSIGANVLRSSS
jgi:hypothetical protein